MTCIHFDEAQMREKDGAFFFFLVRPTRAQMDTSSQNFQIVFLGF